MKRQVAPDIGIVVEHGDALAIQADVLALKYANTLYGVDRAVAVALAGHVPDITERLPKPSEFYVTATGGAIAASNVLFVGVGPLRQFGYGEIRAFARKALEALAGEAPHAVHVALTVHGPGYGLDETEAFESELAGLLDAINSGDFPADLKQLTIVEANPGRARRLATLLDKLLPDGPGGSRAAQLDLLQTFRIECARSAMTPRTSHMSSSPCLSPRRWMMSSTTEFRAQSMLLGSCVKGRTCRPSRAT